MITIGVTIILLGASVVLMRIVAPKDGEEREDDYTMW